MCNNIEKKRFCFSEKTALFPYVSSCVSPPIPSFCIQRRYYLLLELFFKYGKISIKLFV